MKTNGSQKSKTTHCRIFQRRRFVFVFLRRGRRGRPPRIAALPLPRRDPRLGVRQRRRGGGGRRVAVRRRRRGEGQGQQEGVAVARVQRSLRRR